MTDMESGLVVKPEVLQALKTLGLKGGKGGFKVSCKGLADEMGTSNQTISRRLQSLDDNDLIERELESDGQWINLTEQGEHLLRKEYEDYRRIFEQERWIELTGEIVTGMGEGSYYISLDGYKNQFIDKLGYEPFPGTLNVELDEESTKKRTALREANGIYIEEWENEERTFGGATCYPAKIDGIEGHVIHPDRTHYQDKMLEVISRIKLFDELDLSEGDSLTVEVLAE